MAKIYLIVKTISLSVVPFLEVLGGVLVAIGVALWKPLFDKVCPCCLAFFKSIGVLVLGQAFSKVGWVEELGAS